MRLADGVDWKSLAGLAGITCVAAAVLGYHPYSEDGGIYVAEIKRALDPRLYPHGSEFVAGHLGWSGFTTVVVWMVQAGMRLEVALLELHLLCLFGLLAAVWQVSRLCYPGRWTSWEATVLVALSLTMPVAGTSLLLMDPYVTARSASLALLVLGLAGLANYLMNHRAGVGLAWSLLALAGAVAAHPLMGGYGVGFAAMFGLAMDRRRWVRVGGVVACAGLAGIACGAAQALGRAESAEYAAVVTTRYYWFLGKWQWYEAMGLVAPLVILGWAGWRRDCGRVERGLARAAVSVGLIAVAVSLVFAHEGAAVHAVARLQPLRCFQMVYLVLLIVLGGWAGRVIRQKWPWVVGVVVLGGTMVFVQRMTYPASPHLELPEGRTTNRWEQAFLWIRENTPRMAFFATDADYTHLPGEDSQGFRALAERSVLPDYSKDGGQAAIRPELTPAWAEGQRAQAGLSDETEAERIAKLKGLGVTWVVLTRKTGTVFACPYENEAVKVCKLP